MYLARKPLEFKTLSALLRLYSLARKSHYEVLRLRKNCTEKEIKEAFIKMSKEFHPDKNKDVAAQERFVEVVEAYNVLSKPGSRARYDSIGHTPVSTYTYKPSTPYNARRNPYTNNYNYQYHYQNQYQNAQDKAKNSTYYGNSGMKMPNYVIIFVCLSLALVGGLVQIFIIREMSIVQKKQALEKSKHLGSELEKVRAAAVGNGNDLQSRILLEKIVTASNPTAATASLGQALASEKKDRDLLVSEVGIPDIFATDLRSCNFNRNTMETHRPHYGFQAWYLH